MNSIRIKCPHAVSLVILFIVLAMTIPVPVFSAGDENILESRILKVGEKAPDFSVKTLEGKQFELSSHLGKKPVLLFFWSFFCGPCREEMPSLQEVYTQIGQDRMEFLGVNLDGKGLSKAIDKFIETSKLQFVPLFDELIGVNYKVADPYGVAGTPTVYIIDKNGNIAFAAVGRVEPEELKKVLKAILAGN